MGKINKFANIYRNSFGQFKLSEAAPITSKVNMGQPVSTKYPGANSMMRAKSNVKAKHSHAQ